MPTTQKQLDYLYIRAWGRMLRSNSEYIAMEVEQARDDQAPETAVYRDFESGHWFRWEDITSTDTKTKIESLVEEMKSRRK